MMLNDQELCFTNQKGLLTNVSSAKLAARCRPMETEGVLLLAVQASGIKSKETQHRMFML